MPRPPVRGLAEFFLVLRIRRVGALGYSVRMFPYFWSCLVNSNSSSDPHVCPSSKPHPSEKAHGTSAAQTGFQIPSAFLVTCSELRVTIQYTCMAKMDHSTL